MANEARGALGDQLRATAVAGPKTRERRSSSAPPAFAYLRPRQSQPNARSVHECLETLERQHAHLLRCGLRLEDYGLLGKRIDALTFLRGGLLHDLHLEQAGHREHAVAPQALPDHAIQ